MQRVQSLAKYFGYTTGWPDFYTSRIVLTCMELTIKAKIACLVYSGPQRTFAFAMTFRNCS